jgi:citryl-CoA synthetase large subunit
MILYEFEGKELLKTAGIAVPNSQLITQADLDSGQAQITVKAPCVLKAQVLSGKRAASGGIVIVRESRPEDDQPLAGIVKEMMGKVVNNEVVDKVLVEEKADIAKEYYLSLTYDGASRSPLLNLSSAGGTGIEERGVDSFVINPLNISTSLESIQSDIPADLITKIIQHFLDLDATLLEINPLVKTTNGQWIALDAKIKLDDSALSRHEDWHFAPRGVPGYTATENEIAAKRIDEDDYRGTAGSAYFDIEGGDIAVLSSGGGVSLTAMDTLITFGGKPANFTEYSGNPPKEKVTKLTKIVLNKPNIHGLWVIGTVVANFTDIYETLSGLIEGLRQAQTELNTEFKFPIVIRRGGPREEEAFAMLREVKEFDLHLQGEETSIVQSAKVMTELAKEYAAHT